MMWIVLQRNIFRDFCGIYRWNSHAPQPWPWQLARAMLSSDLVSDHTLGMRAFFVCPDPGMWLAMKRKTRNKRASILCDLTISFLSLVYVVEFSLIAIQFRNGRPFKNIRCMRNPSTSLHAFLYKRNMFASLSIRPVHLWAECTPHSFFVTPFYSEIDEVCRIVSLIETKTETSRCLLLFEHISETLFSWHINILSPVLKEAIPTTAITFGTTSGKNWSVRQTVHSLVSYNEKSLNDQNLQLVELHCCKILECACKYNKSGMFCTFQCPDLRNTCATSHKDRKMFLSIWKIPKSLNMELRWPLTERLHFVRVALS